MSAAQHTPGPWVISERNEHLILIQSKKVQKSRKVHVVLADVPANHINAEANARLIAAAPELLAALKLANEAMNHMGDVLNGMDAGEPEDEAKCTPAFKAVRALLSKLEA